MARDRNSLLPEWVRSRYTVRLGFALALAILVVVASGAAISQQAQATLQEDVQNDLVTLSETRADQLDTWLSSVKSHVTATSRLAVMESGDPDRIGDELSAAVSEGQVPDNVVAVHYFDTERGEIVASSDEQFVGARPAEQGAPFAENPPQFDGPHDVHVSEPFEIGIVDYPIVAVISPVPGADDKALIYMTDLEAKTLELSQSQDDVSTVVVDGEGRFVAHPDTSRILERHDGSANGMSTPEGQFVERERDDGTMLMGVTRMENEGWTVMTHAHASEAYALGAQINADLVGLILLAVINLGLVGVTIGSGTAISLRRLSRRARAMADGDLGVDLASAREDEIGTVYRTFAEMRDSLRSKIDEAEQARQEADRARQKAEREREEVREMNQQLEARAGEYSDVLEAITEGDLTVRADVTDDEEGAMAEIGHAINEAIADLETTIANTQSFAENVLESGQEVEASAETVDEASERVRESIREIYEGASEQSDSLQGAAGEMENLSATAQQVASSAQQVADTSENAARVGETGREATQEAIEGMNAIEEETEATVREINALDDDLDEIGEIVELITEIVEQTNILALNASIEAAHADADGDGFAVVADEIKGLAEETKDAAGDIEDRIERIQRQAGETVDTMERTQRRISDGVGTVEEAIDALETIVEYTEEVDAGIQEIDDATAEQANTSQAVLETIDQLTAISQQTAAEADTVAEAADEQTASTGEVSENAEALRARARELSNLLARFEADAVQAAGGDSHQPAVTTDDD